MNLRMIRGCKVCQTFCRPTARRLKPGAEPLATLAQTTTGIHPKPGVPIATGVGAIEPRTGIPGEGSFKFRVSGADKRLL